MKIFDVKSLDATPSNDEGLALLYFDLGDFEYFTLCFSDEEQESIYIEYSEQTQSAYSNNISYQFIEGGLVFEFCKDVAEEIKLDSPVLFQLNLEKESISLLKSSLNSIFKSSAAKRNENSGF